MFGAVAFTSISDSPLGICLSPLLLLLSLAAAFPIYFLKPCPLLICSSYLPLTWEKDAKGWSGGEFISSSLNKISEFHSAQVLESILLLYKKLWACFKTVSYSPTVTPSPHPTPEPSRHLSSSLPWEPVGFLEGKLIRVWPSWCPHSQLVTLSLQKFVKNDHLSLLSGLWSYR